MGVVSYAVANGKIVSETRAGGPDRRMVRAVCQGTGQALQRAGRLGRALFWRVLKRKRFPHHDAWQREQKVV